MVTTRQTSYEDKRQKLTDGVTRNLNKAKVSIHRHTEARKAIKQEIAETLDSFQSKHARVRLRKARRYQRQTKVALKVAKNDYKQAKKRLKQVGGQPAQDKLKQVTKDLKAAKTSHKAAKKVRRVVTKQAGDGLVKRNTKHQLHTRSRSAAESMVAETDIMDDLVTSRQKIRETKHNAHRAKRIARYSQKTATVLGKGAVKGSYAVANRTYNWTKGRGFTRTAKADRWETAVAKRLKQLRYRLAQGRLGKVRKSLQTAAKPVRFLTKPLLHILKNPLSFSSFGLLLIVLFFIATFMSIPATVEQDEFDLTESWLLMTKMDREQSTDKVDYWTNIDDVMFYMNYRYGGFTLKERWPDKQGLHPHPMSDALKDIWEQLNKDTAHLKTMGDLVSQKDSWTRLEPDVLKDYQEQLEEANTYGRYLAYQELDNPLSSPDEETSQALTIINRFGHTSKTDIKTSSTLQASQGQEVYAAMTGQATVEGDKLIISLGKSRLTYHQLAGIRVKTGDQVATGGLLGRTSSNGLELTYEKQDDKGTWQTVNIGFYFEKVTYSQTTSVLTNLDLDGDKATRALRVQELIQKHVKGATLEGISAVLGAYDVESGITFKRYETDTLTGNQFDKMAQEPSVENLLGSWAAFAQLYTASPPEHRPNPNGYLVNGKHFLGLGIGQWTGGRAVALWEFAKRHNLDMWSEEAQIRFLLEGDSPYYREIFRKTVTGTGSVEALTEEFLAIWLGVPGNKLLERQHSAKQWLSYLKQGGRISSMGAGDFGSIFDRPYLVTQAYGNHWAIYQGGVHLGLDLVPVAETRAETPLYAISDGVVVKSSDANDGYGYSLQHTMPDGRYAHYAHLRYLPKFKVGDKIKRGDQIGVMGNTGLSFGDHLHFEILINYPYGQKVDPSYVLVERGSVRAGTILEPRK